MPTATFSIGSRVRRTAVNPGGSPQTGDLGVVRYTDSAVAGDFRFPLVFWPRRQMSAVMALAEIEPADCDAIAPAGKPSPDDPCFDATCPRCKRHRIDTPSIGRHFLFRGGELICHGCAGGR